MHVGLLMLALHLRSGSSLKEKRSVVHGLVETLQRRFRLAVAEVEDLNVVRRATLGLACVANDARHVASVLDAALEHVEAHVEVDVEVLYREESTV